MEKFCRTLVKFVRRDSDEVRIGRVAIGGANPVAVQSMTNVSTMDTPACIAQAAEIRRAGCRVVRLTAPGKREAENLRAIAAGLREAGHVDLALVADIHFTPDVAMIAADYVDKVRVNPGNYKNGDGQLGRLIEKCRERGVALRIGVNHGSLAAHIVEKWGDTPRGMVESAMEFLRECRAAGFGQVVVSMKSSNVRVMVHAYRLLSARLEEEGMRCPLHLGVTEAGDGDEGRIKSAVGIGALLADGLGDTIRVSLTEPPENEVPVARAIVDYVALRAESPEVEAIADESLYSPFEYRRRRSVPVGIVGGEGMPVLYSELAPELRVAAAAGGIAVLEAASDNPAAEWRAAVLNMMAAGDARPVILHRKYNEQSPGVLRIKAAVDFGMAFIDGLADGIWIENERMGGEITQDTIDRTALSILQAARVRMSMTEYIACPGCGRTLFDLQSTLAAVKERTSHLKHLKIGVMGCVVNGPGEMADADYGYVGAGAGRVTLYKSREVVRRDIPQSDALDALVELIKDNGQWVEP